MEMVKLNTELVPVEGLFVEQQNSYEYFFIWNNQRYRIEDFLRVHNNPWFPMDADIYPDYIHGIEIGNWYNPIFIELVDGHSYVNIYVESEV